MIGEALRLIRVFHSLKAKDLAKQIGISNSYLSQIETGKRKPSLKIIETYSHVFSVPKSAIMFFSEELEKEGVKVNGLKIRLLVRKTMIKFLKIVENFSKGRV